MNSDMIDLKGFVTETNGVNGNSYDKNNNATGHSHSKHHYNLNAITNTYISFLKLFNFYFKLLISFFKQ